MNSSRKRPWNLSDFDSGIQVPASTSSKRSRPNTSSGQVVSDPILLSSDEDGDDDDFCEILEGGAAGPHHSGQIDSIPMCSTFHPTSASTYTSSPMRSAALSGISRSFSAPKTTLPGFSSALDSFRANPRAFIDGPSSIEMLNTGSVSKPWPQIQLANGPLPSPFRSGSPYFKYPTHGPPVNINHRTTVAPILDHNFDSEDIHRSDNIFRNQDLANSGGFPKSENAFNSDYVFRPKHAIKTEESLMNYPKQEHEEWLPVPFGKQEETTAQNPYETTSNVAVKFEQPMKFEDDDELLMFDPSSSQMSYFNPTMGDYNNWHASAAITAPHTHPASIDFGHGQSYYQDYANHEFGLQSMVSAQELAREAQQQAEEEEKIRKRALEAQLEKMPLTEQPPAIKTKMLPHQLQAVSVDNPPDLYSGGVLADDMGLGKTLQMISLIMSDRVIGSTLIICPLSVMSNWEQQFKQHIHQDHAVRVLVYHSQKCAKLTLSDLEAYDIIITTYNKLAMELAGKKMLSLMSWRRVILDEECQTFVADFCLRRTKDMDFVNLKLPTKTEHVEYINFNQKEAENYQVLFKDAQEAARRFFGKDKDALWSTVLEKLLRLRQFCNHWTMSAKKAISHDDPDYLAHAELKEAEMASPELCLKALVKRRELCPICWDALTVDNEPVISPCMHGFCRPCINQAFPSGTISCPKCSTEFDESALKETKFSDEELQADLDLDVSEFGDEISKQSSKTIALYKLIKKALKAPDSKVVIFSQWTSFLDIVERELSALDMQHVRLDGRMNGDQRDVSIKAIQNDANVRVMLASLRAAGVGITLTSADTVILADTWWAPAIEEQAIDRIHRLGQTKPTTVYRLVVKDTVEEKVIIIQDEKRKLFGEAFQETFKTLSRDVAQNMVRQLLSD
ncbi:SNF2 family domain-containing protein [Ceratocystis lukuohia]|uniref:SNF2 family domain-containing protein n=2 Tax=Ceratocystis TaxID=5157 RepID=A0ABR4MAE2_9PEZI